MNINEAIKSCEFTLNTLKAEDWRRVALFSREAVELLLDYVKNDLEKPELPTTNWYDK